MIEQWLPISGFEGLYEVSNTGLVRSPRGVRKPITNSFGYLQLGLYKHGKGYTKRVNRLVAEAFIPNPDNKREVNHIDGNKLNNNVDNLEWVSSSENKIHAQRLGLSSKPPLHKGESTWNSKLTKQEVLEIRRDYKRFTRGCGATTLGKKYGVSARTITYIVNGQRWND